MKPVKLGVTCFAGYLPWGEDGRSNRAEQWCIQKYDDPEWITYIIDEDDVMRLMMRLDNPTLRQMTLRQIMIGMELK